MRIAILGSGYVGLVSGVCLAAKGHEVTCLDIDPQVVEKLNVGEPHIHERGLPELLSQTVVDGRFRSRLAEPQALVGHDVVMIAVGTPSSQGRIDLKFVRAAATIIGRHIASAEEPITVVVKSTVVPGTTDTVVRQAIQGELASSPRVYGLGMNPEFLREGEAIDDFMNPDRIVMGFEDELALQHLRSIYAPWSCTKLEVNTRTAEMIKYANNCLLATQISAVNELARVARAIGAIDMDAVVVGVRTDRRWNPIDSTGAHISPGIVKYLVPGGGFGGSCFPKDLQALRTLGQSLNLPMQLLQAVLEVNDGQVTEIIKVLAQDLGDLTGKRLLVLGRAFKPGTDDTRDSPAVRLIVALIHAGADVISHDPIAPYPDTHQRSASLQVVDNWPGYLQSADGIVIATAWPEYEILRDADIRSQLVGKVLVDTRSLLSGIELPGVEYRTVAGRRAHPISASPPRR